MTTIVGGLRTRYVHNSLQNMIEDALNDIGWMDPGRAHKSVTIQGQPLGADEEAQPNLIAIDLYDSDMDDAEMGSSVLTLDTYMYAIDIYAESAALGMHLAGDIRDLLKGKFSATASRTGPTLPIYDYSLTTPAVFATGNIDTIQLEKARTYDKPHEKYYWQLFFRLEDEYGDEAD